MIRERITKTIANLSGDLRSVTKALFWATGGSLVTLYVFFPDSPVTVELVRVELALLAGMGLGYLSFGRDQP